MKLDFYKYQATGNDFILVDDRSRKFDTSNNSLIQHLCHRKFGIGADGLILFRNEPGYDFRMVYFNSDGYEGSMCGNGGRCITTFANFLQPLKTEFRFMAWDGEHTARITSNQEARFTVDLSMSEVRAPESRKSDFFVNTGSPHIVRFIDDAAAVDVNLEGRKIRNSSEFLANGVNVNFVELHNGSLTVRTYERGVEEETLSCGTGVTAAAITAYASGRIKSKRIPVFTRGGRLDVSFEPSDSETFREVHLAGEAGMVFQGSIEI